MDHNENNCSHYKSGNLYLTVSLGASGDQPIGPEQAKKDL